MRVRPGGRVRVTVQMRATGGMLVHVQVEDSTPPADEEPDGERDDHEADRRLGPLLDPFGQVRLEEHDREPEEEQ